MNIHTRFIGTVAILDLHGRFDAHVAPQVSLRVQQAVADNLKHIVVNMDRVNFIDSLALAILAKESKSCRQIGGDLRICNLQQPVKIIFELTRLDRALSIFACEDEAVKKPW